MPRKIERLRKEALESCNFRGHKMGRFIYTTLRYFVDICVPEDRTLGYSECKVCGKCVNINTRPLPNQIEIGGEAVALGCED